MSQAVQVFTIPDHPDNPDIARAIIDNAQERCDMITSRIMTFRRTIMMLLEVPGLSDDAKNIICQADNEMDVLQLLSEGNGIQDGRRNA